MQVSRREGCIIAKMKKYAVDEVIFGDNTGIRNFVYFVLSGCCQMIETMKVLETTRLGRTSYTLYDPYVNTFFCQLSIVFFFVCIVFCRTLKVKPRQHSTFYFI